MSMSVAVEFQDERVDVDVPEGRLVGSWHGPRGVPAADVPALIADALERPRDYPPLRQAVVPGDRVVIALGDDVPEAPAVLRAVSAVLTGSGVEPGGMTVLTAAEARGRLSEAVPPGVTFLTHDPDDRPNLAYLATTVGGRRVYLNRVLTDADFVLPIGRLGYDPVLGYQGPWGVIDPGFSDAERLRSALAGVNDDVPDRGRPRLALTESTEVSWLLGSQFQVGVIEGVSGVVGVVAGLGSAVLDQGAREVDDAWSFHAESRAELVIAGVGRPGRSAGLDDVARGLSAAVRLVQRGGKIALLSRAEGPIGPAVRRLLDAGDPRSTAAALKGHEADPDYPAARQIARALAWADVYLLSGLNPDDVEDLSMIPLDRPEEARRLAAVVGSSLLVSQADRVRAVASDESE